MKELKEFCVTSTETIRKEVYVMAKNWEHAEEIASGDVDWEILSSPPPRIDADRRCNPLRSAGRTEIPPGLKRKKGEGEGGRVISELKINSYRFFSKLT